MNKQATTTKNTALMAKGHWPKMSGVRSAEVKIFECRLKNKYVFALMELSWFSKNGVMECHRLHSLKAKVIYFSQFHRPGRNHKQIPSPIQ